MRLIEILYMYTTYDRREKGVPDGSCHALKPLSCNRYREKIAYCLMETVNHVSLQCNKIYSQATIFMLELNRIITE